MLAGLLFAVLAARDAQAEPHAKPGAAKTVVVEIQEELHVAAQARLMRAIREASATPGSAVLIEIDTPGGNVELMWDMGNAIHKASRAGGGPVEMVAFIPGGRNGGAGSAGSFLALACDHIYMSKGTLIGDAQPIFQSPLGPMSAEGKMIEWISQRFRAMAEMHGREWRIAAAFVDPPLGLLRVRTKDGETSLRTSRELDELDARGERYEIVSELKPRGTDRPFTMQADKAYELGFIDGIVADRDELVHTLGRERDELVTMPPSSGEQLVEWITTATPFLLVLGLILGFVESKIPGFGVAGILSTICFGLVFYGRYLLGVADILEILLFALGLVLIAIEIFFAPGTLAFGILGGICVVGALILSFQGFVIPKDPIDLNVLTRNLTSFAGIAIAAGLGMFAVSFLLPKTPFVAWTRLHPPENVEGSAAGAVEEARSLVGRVATAATDLRPAGIVEIDGARIDAVAEGSFVERGARVRIQEVTGNRVVVAPESRTA